MARPVVHLACHDTDNDEDHELCSGAFTKLIRPCPRDGPWHVYTAHGNAHGEANGLSARLWDGA